MKRVCSNEIWPRTDCIPIKLATASWRPLPRLPSKRPIPTNLSCPHPLVRVYNGLSFRPLRPSGIPWLQWRRRQVRGRAARATCFPRVPVETLAPPVLREKPLERKRSPEDCSARLSSFPKIAFSHQHSVSIQPRKVVADCDAGQSWLRADC